jgi:polyhydroxyalkanoate synthesis regulator phasin
LPGDFVTPDKSVLKPYFDQRVETGRNPKIITQKVDVKDLVIGDEVTDFVYRPQSPLKSQPNVAKPLLSDISKTTSTPQHNLKMAKESGRSFEDLLKDSPEMLKGRTGFDTPPQTVKVYRGVSQEGRNIRSGDWVTTNPEYAKKYGGVVQELEVSAKDLKYMNGSAQGNAMGEFPEYIYTGKFSGQKPVSPLGLTVGESNVGSVGNTTPEILVKNPPTKEVFHNPIVPQKQFTQLGSATNTRADQIAPKLRKPAPFEVEMDAQVGKPYEKPFKGRSKLKLKEPTKLPGDQATADFATARAAMGGNGVKGLPKETSDQFQKWVNTRRATQLEGVLKKKEYADLNNKGIEGIFEFQSGNKTGRYGDVKKYFDTKYKTLQDNKIEFDFRQDYLPQLWNNTPEEINQVMGRRMGMKPSFTLDAVFKSYKEGIDAGLTPKFQNISDLVGWYEQKANKAIADKNFFDYLGKDGTILPSTKAPMEWETLDPDRFPKFLTQIADEKFAGTYKAPKEVADVINGYLRDPQMPMLEKVANYVSGVKSIALNFGIPGTAINAHGINILTRHSLMGTGGNPISRFVKGAHFMLDQRSAGKMLDKQMVNAPKAMKDGLMLSSDDYSNRIIEATGLKQKFGKKWEEVFGGPLFNKMLPSLKLSSYEELVKNGMDGKDAAKLVNNVYGGINWEQMGRSKDIQNLLRIAILAPDWAETTLRTGGNFVKALNPKDRSMVMNRYRTMMATILGSYVAHNIANKLTSGHYSFENEPSNIFNIQVGYTEDGEKRYIRPYGTGLDMVRLPAEVAMGLFKGDLTGVTRLLRNRLSIPAGVALGALTDQDYRGNAIGYRGTDKFGNEMPMGQRAMNIGTEMASLVGLPSFIKQFGMSATGQQSMEAGLTQAFELPTRYQNPGKSKTQEYVGRVSELKGKDLYDLKTRFKGESPFSDNQKAVINQGGLPALEQVMQLREQKRQVNKSKDIQEQVVNGEITEEEGKKALEEILKTSAPVTQKKVDSTNKAYASDTVTGSFSEDIAKNRVKLTKKSERLGNKIIYPTEDGAATIDLTPPTKGTGIGAYANKDWNITKARSIWNNEQVTKEDKDYAFKQLGVKPEDVRYDALANYDVDIKAQYLSSKSTTKERLIENIKTGRKRSVGDLVFASDGVIDAMVDEGRLTKEEAKELKAIDYDKSGKLKIKAGGKGRKLKIGSTPTMKAINIGTPSKMAQVSFAKRSPKLQLKARPAKIKVKLKKLQAKRQKASKLKIKSLKSANV